MNYIKEINAFYQRQETNPLSSSAANLWHTFMHVNNRAGWRESFTVAASVLCVKASLSESTFKRARTELRDKGYIRYQSRGGNRAAMYELVSLELAASSTVGETGGVAVEGPESEVEVRVKRVGNVDHSAGSLVKQEKTKETTATAAGEAGVFFEKNMGELRPYIQHDLIRYVEDLGEYLVVAAMKRGLERGKRSWGYVKGILDNWVAKGVETVEDAERELVKYRDKQSGGGRGEVIPDWFRERKQGQKHVERSRPETCAEMKEREEIKQLLAKHA